MFVYLFVLCYIFANVATLQANSVVANDAMPSFDRASENVTVVSGGLANLPCFINNLGDHKVAWIKVGNTDIIAIGDYKVSNDDRIRLVHGYIADWSLSIQQVNEEDAGEYLCQVNTEPQIISRIFLQVLIPPSIIEEKSTQNPGPVTEYSRLQLHCYADGVPKPKISWFFRKRYKSTAQQNLILAKKLNSNQQHVIHEGNTLTIENITRHDSGIYECLANNSVHHAASRKIKVSVEFSPEIEAKKKRVEQMIGYDARFECIITSNPLINHYWMKDGMVIENSLTIKHDGGLETEDANKRVRKHHRKHHRRRNVYHHRQQYVHNRHNHHQYHHYRSKHNRHTGKNNGINKYEIINYSQNTHEYVTVSALVIKNITKSDFGIYQCFAVNLLNTTKTDFELKEIVYRRIATTSKAAVASRILFYSNSKVNKNEEDDEESGNSSGRQRHHKINSNKISSNESGERINGRHNNDYLISSNVKSDDTTDEHLLNDLNENSLYLLNNKATSCMKSSRFIYLTSIPIIILMQIFKNLF